MAIPGLFIRSFGTGPDALNNAEANALKSMRERQAFADEQEARRRRAGLENIALGASMPTAPPLAAPGEQTGTGIRGAAADIARQIGTPAPAAPAAGVVAPAPAGVSVTGVPPTGDTPSATPAPTTPATARGGNRRLDYETVKQAVSRSTARINPILTELDRLEKQRFRPYPLPEIQYKKQKADLESQLAFERANQTKLVAEMKRLAKPVSTAAPAPTRVGVPFLLAKPEGAAPDVSVQPAAASRAQRPVATTAAEALMKVLSREGGYVNNPDDPGGETKYGISKRSYPDVDIANLNRDEAEKIYKRDYWDAMNIDQLPPEMREIVFDAAVNQGKGFASEALQKSGMNPATFLALREQRYRDIVAKDPSQAQFLGGWLARVNEFRGGATQLGATAAPASNAVLPPVEQAKLSDYSNAVPRLEYNFNQKLQERAEIARRAEAARNEGIPELYAQSVEQLKQIDRELFFMQGMVGLGDLVDNPAATQRLSQVMSYFRGKKPGYYVLQPRSDGTYNEIVGGKVSREGVTLQEVIDKTRMVFDEGYAASVNATRAKQAEAAIEIDGKSKLLAQEYGFKLTQALAEKEADALIETLKSNSAFKQAVAVATINNQGKAPEIKLFNTASGITVGTVGSQMFKIVQEEDRDGNLIAGTEFLKVLPRE